MDLLGRKARKQLDLALEYAVHLEGVINEQATAVSLEKNRSAYMLDSLNRSQSFTRELISEIAVLNARLAVATKPVVVEKPQTRPIHMSEEEQEIAFQLANNMIDKKEYETLLEELDFQNASVEIDPDFAPRPDLTY